MFYCIAHYVIPINIVKGAAKLAFYFPSNKNPSTNEGFLTIDNKYINFYKPLIVIPTCNSLVSGATPSLKIPVILYAPNNEKMP